jgi:Tol biopolymer transport system component
MRLDGGGVQRVTNSPQQEALARWSPDGKALVFADLAPPLGIWISRRDGAGHWGQSKRLQVGGFFPLVSPDGRSIVYSDGIFGSRIQSMPIDSGPERTVFTGTGGASWITWSTDGLLYVSVHDAQGNASIWSVVPTTGASRLIVRFDPQLHPSYRTTIAVGNGRIYFSAENRESDVWVMDVRKP